MNGDFQSGIVTLCRRTSKDLPVCSSCCATNTVESSPSMVASSAVPSANTVEPRSTARVTRSSSPSAARRRRWKPRTRAYEKLDALITKRYAPWLAYANRRVYTLLSARVRDYVFNPSNRSHPFGRRVWSRCGSSAAERPGLGQASAHLPPSGDPELVAGGPSLWGCFHRGARSVRRRASTLRVAAVRSVEGPRPRTARRLAPGSLGHP